MTGLRFSAVGRHFGKHVALEDLELDCPAGVLTCLVGPNGAGKSTALALAAGLIAPTAGEILFAERVVRPEQAPETTGYLPQRSAFHRSFTVAEVLNFTSAARSATEAERRRAVAVTGLAEVENRFVGELSGGWVRRLGLFSALLGSPALLLLDEPFVGLDPETQDRLLVHLRERLETGATIVMASHDFEVLDPLRPTVAVLEDGFLRLTAAVRPDGHEADLETNSGNGNTKGTFASSRSVYRRALAPDASEDSKTVEAVMARGEPG